MNLDDFMIKTLDVEDEEKLIKAVLYDFTEDTVLGDTLKDTYQRADCLERYKLYSENGRIGDPDENKYPSKLLQEVFKQVWSNADYCEWKKKGNRCTDTMTSVTKRIEDFLANSKDHYANPSVKADWREHYEFSSRQRLSKLLLCTLIDDRKVGVKDLAPLLPFLQVHHCIGNYCQVSPCFNMSRSGGAICDFWDLTLEKIHAYYHTGNGIQELLHEKADEIKNCKEWLDSYGKGNEGWKCFVKDNCFEDYVCNTDYSLKPFVIDHNWENKEIDQGKWEEFSKEVRRRIVIRGIRIICKLNQIQSDDEDIINAGNKVIEQLEEDLEKMLKTS